MNLASLISGPKRTAIIVTLHFIVFAFIATIIYNHSGLINAVKLPPSSLSQWYKPENKRQVWLHNMFKLRREMQAVEFYAQNQNPEQLAKWSKRLTEHYLKIADMVPEWQDKLSSTIIAELMLQIEQKRFIEIPKTLKALKQNCQSCHTDYQATTAAMYRAPNFSGLSLITNKHSETRISYTQHMDALSKQVNQIKIASEDRFNALALSSLTELEQGMNLLGKTCTNCHKNEIEAYPSQVMKNTLGQLEQSLKTGSLKEQGRALGTLAVQACARCHGTHRTSFNARKQLTEKMQWGQLLKH